MEQSNIAAISAVEHTVGIVAAYVGRNTIAPSDLPKIIGDVHRAVIALESPPEEPAPELTPAVPVKKSILPDFIVCLDDGRKFKSLKRHLASLGMTPEQYRAKWGLPADYPMVAPNYSAKRSTLAKAAGLGKVGR